MTDKGEPYSTDGYLTVQRGLNNGTSLVETWQIQNYNWHLDDSDGIDPTVHCYVADINEDVPPRRKEAATSSCNFSELPESVQDEFIEQLERLKKFKDVLESLPDKSEDDNSE